MAELHNANKQLACVGPIAAIEAKCQALHVLDKKTETRKKLLIAGMVVGLPVGIFAITLNGLVAAAGFGLFLAALIGYFSIKNNDIEDRKLDTARIVLDTLRDELRPDKPISLDIEFRSYDRAPDPGWMALQFTLHNGVAVKLDASTHYKRKTRQKRKYTKIKDKLHERLAVTYHPPKGHRFDPDAQTRIKAPPVKRPGGGSGLSMRSAKVSPSAATFVFSTRPMVRVSGRGGFDDTGLVEILDGPAAVAAVIGSYRALAAAGAIAGAGAGA